MKVDFFHSNPRERVYKVLDDLLRFGTSRLAIANAFCTKSGVSFLKNHANLLNTNDSFLVVSYNRPTDYYALGELHKKAPGHVFVNYGAGAPHEYVIGTPILHSKVFYAEKGSEAKLWVGSHNLTGNALLGLNMEAGIYMHGAKTDEPFVEALRHLEACRSASYPYDPTDSGGGISEPESNDVLIIHAECKRIPEEAFNWTIELMLNSSSYDHLFATPAQIRLYLYKEGGLSNGLKGAVPLKKYKGTLTGVNLTKKNVQVRELGTNASWEDAKFNIGQEGKVLFLSDSPSKEEGTQTQVVFTVDKELTEEECYLSVAPNIGPHLSSIESEWIPSESDMYKNYKPEHIHITSLLYKELQKKGYKYSVNEDDVDEREMGSLRERLRGANAHEVIREKPKKKTSNKPQHPFIKRAKYIL